MSEDRLEKGDIVELTQPYKMSSDFTRMQDGDQKNWSGNLIFKSYTMGGSFVVLTNGEETGITQLTVSKRFIRFVKKGD